MSMSLSPGCRNAGCLLDAGRIASISTLAISHPQNCTFSHVCRLGVCRSKDIKIVDKGSASANLLHELQQWKPG